MFKFIKSNYVITGDTWSYSFAEKDGVTTLTGEIGVPLGLEEIFKDWYPKVLKRMKVLVEKG